MMFDGKNQVEGSETSWPSWSGGEEKKIKKIQCSAAKLFQIPPLEPDKHTVWERKQVGIMHMQAPVLGKQAYFLFYK